VSFLHQLLSAHVALLTTATSCTRHQQVYHPLHYPHTACIIVFFSQCSSRCFLSLSSFLRYEERLCQSHYHLHISLTQVSISCLKPHRGEGARFLAAMPLNPSDTAIDASPESRSAAQLQLVAGCLSPGSLDLWRALISTCGQYKITSRGSLVISQVVEQCLKGSKVPYPISQNTSSPLRQHLNNYLSANKIWPVRISLKFWHLPRISYIAPRYKTRYMQRGGFTSINSLALQGSREWLSVVESKVNVVMRESSM
jgi:hypothetical protein